MQVDGANGPVNVTTGNGRVFVATAKGVVDATTGNGDIDCSRIKALPVEGDMRFNSGSGSIRVMLPANYNGRIDATSGNGNLSSDFEISIVGRRTRTTSAARSAAAAPSCASPPATAPSSCERTEVERRLIALTGTQRAELHHTRAGSAHVDHGTTRLG